MARLMHLKELRRHFRCWLPHPHGDVMLRHSYAMLLLALFAQPSLAQAPDTLAAVAEAREAIGKHYYLTGPRGFMPSEPSEDRDLYRERGEWLGFTCSLDEGERCLGEDRLFSVCPADSACGESSEDLLETLVRLAEASPTSGYIMGQAVALLVRLQRAPRALDLVEKCAASDWWCSALRGHVLHSVGNIAGADVAFRTALSAAPSSVACELTDAFWLLGRWSFFETPLPPPSVWSRSISRIPCADRAATSDRLWWLADPLYVVEGNDRWTAHVNRAFTRRLDFEQHEAEPTAVANATQLATRFAPMVRRGPWDSYDWRRRRDPNGYAPIYTSLRAARYHFVPDFVGDGLESPMWRLDADRLDEGYTPPFGAFYQIPAQVARFHATEAGTPAGEVRYAVAGSLSQTPISEIATSGYLVFTDEPESFPVLLEAPILEGRAVFLVNAPSREWVSSLEILTEAGVGWWRAVIEPISFVGPAVSDLLLYEPAGFTEPDSLIAAASMMLGTTDVTEVPELGLYWEVYGADESSSVSFELQIEGEDGSFLQRVRRLLPGGNDVGSVTLRWDEPGAGPVLRRAILLDLGDLEPGLHTIVLRAQWGEHEPIESRRVIQIGR